MIEYKYSIQGESIRVNVLENTADIPEFEYRIKEMSYKSPIGVDSEATGLQIYGKDRLRMAQFGDDKESFVVPTELSSKYCDTTVKALSEIPLMVLHNASFDLQVFERNLGVSMESLWPRVLDTRIFSHLVDPRGQEEGGIGQGLEQLVRHYIDPVVAEEVKGLMTKLARSYKITKAEIWDRIDIDHPDYNLYAGMDPILAVRLLKALQPLVPNESRRLVEYEHRIAEACSYMERNGFLLDTEYSKELSKKLQADEEEASWHAAAFFEVESVNSTAQVADALEELGVTGFGKTPTGKRKVDNKLLEKLSAEVPEIGSAAHLVEAVSEAKKARKWRTTWLDGFVDAADNQDRVHASINPLRARTARMSISVVPAQTLPSGDWIIRRCFIADPGHVICSVDYDSQELRVLAAISQDPTMMAAFEAGDDLHQITADAAGVPRKTGKMANFLKVYGGGASKLADNAGIPEDLARKVLQGFDATYPGVKKLSKELQKQAETSGHVVTPFGRVLPVDQDRGYSALNYCVSPDTVILRADLCHVPASEIKSADKLIGFDENTPGKGRVGQHRKFRTSEVEKVSRVVKPSLEIVDSSGQKTVCSVDHLWLVKFPKKQPRLQWVKAGDLVPGMILLSVGTWEVDNSRIAGYLSGLYDGEGSLSGRAAGRKQTSLVFSQRRGKVMDRFCKGMEELNLRYSYYKKSPNSTSPTDTVSVQGIPNILKVLGILRPERFIDRAWEVFEGRSIVGGRQFTELTVSKISDVGQQELMSIQTSTRTFIANGILSHNCVQSSSRDITCQALIRLHKSGFTEYMRLPIHDEMLFSFPEDSAEWMTSAAAEIMSQEFKGVLISASGQVGKRSWGSLYNSEY